MRAQDTNFNPAGVMETVVRKTKSAAAIGALLVVLSPISGHVANAAEKPIIPQDPYELMEPAGKSYLGKKGPNLQVMAASTFASSTRTIVGVADQLACIGLLSAATSS